MKQKLWTVYAKSVISYQTDIWAETEEEAIDKARKLDGSEWDEHENTGGIEVTDADLYDEVNK